MPATYNFRLLSPSIPVTIKPSWGSWGGHVVLYITYYTNIEQHINTNLGNSTLLYLLLIDVVCNFCQFMRTWKNETNLCEEDK